MGLLKRLADGVAVEATPEEAAALIGLDSLNGVVGTFASVTNDYQVSTTDKNVLVSFSYGQVVITLPENPTLNREVAIVFSGGGESWARINPHDAELVNGGEYYTLYGSGGIVAGRFAFNGTDWWKVN